MESVLRELEADEKPQIQVMNKIDLLPAKQRESLRDNEQVGPRVGGKRNRSGHSARSNRRTA